MQHAYERPHFAASVAGLAYGLASTISAASSTWASPLAVMGSAFIGEMIWTLLPHLRASFVPDSEAEPSTCLWSWVERHERSGRRGESVSSAAQGS